MLLWTHYNSSWIAPSVSFTLLCNLHQPDLGAERIGLPVAFHELKKELLLLFIVVSDDLHCYNEAMVCSAELFATVLTDVAIQRSSLKGSLRHSLGSLTRKAWVFLSPFKSRISKMTVVSMCRNMQGQESQGAHDSWGSSQNWWIVESRRFVTSSTLASIQLLLPRNYRSTKLFEMYSRCLPSAVEAKRPPSSLSNLDSYWAIKCSSWLLTGAPIGRVTSSLNRK